MTSIQSEFSAQRKGIDTKLTFNDGRTLALQGTRLFSFGTAPGRFAELVAQAVATAPTKTEIDDLTFEIAQWGPREIRQLFQGPISGAETAEKLLDRARHHRVWLESRQALQAVESALRLRPDYPEGLKFRYRLMLERGDMKQARRTAEDWRSRCPQDPEARAAVLLMRLAQDDRTVPLEADRFLETESGQDELMAGLAAYHFRTGDYPQAAKRWGQIAVNAKNDSKRQQAREMQRYAEKTAQDAMFRWREKIMRWGRLTLAWSVLIVVFALQAVRIYEIFTRKEREQERQRQAEVAQRQWAEEAKTRLDAMDRQFTEMTGRVMGDYPAVRARADRGEAAAQLTVAEMLFDGSKGAPKDPVIALEYLEQAAAQGHRAALLGLGQKLVDGKNLPKDEARAAGLFEQAMEKDSPRAAAELAELYQKGNGVEQDKARAFTLYAKAAEGGYVYAMSQAGWMLEQGDGVAANRAAALDYYRRAADKKSDWATERLLNLLGAPASSAEEHNEAWKWLKTGAQRGSAKLRLQAAGAVLSGRQEDAEVLKTAKTWLEAAVATKQPGAATQQGLCFLYGWGMKQDFALARQGFETEQATDQAARSQLARCMAFGVGGPRDVARARELQASLDNPGYRRWLESYLDAAETVPATGPAYKPLFQAPPEYPASLVRQGVEGEAVVKFVIDGEGFTREVEVASASHPDFGYAARLSVSCWRFNPAADGTRASRQITIQFNLQDRSTRLK